RSTSRRASPMAGSWLWGTRHGVGLQSAQITYCGIPAISCWLLLKPSQPTSYRGMGFSKPRNTLKFLDLDLPTPPNGHGIVEFDYTTGHEGELKVFPTPDQLWQRLCSVVKIEDEETAKKLLTPTNAAIGNGQRYYQEIAINRVIQAILQGDKRVLLTMA